MESLFIRLGFGVIHNGAPRHYQVAEIDVSYRFPKGNGIMPK